MNKSDLVARMTERLGGDRSTAAAAVNGILEEIECGVARGERVSLTGFGTFERRERGPRTGRNPRTGASLEVSASVTPVFRAGTGFKALLAPGVASTGATASTTSPATGEPRPADDLARAAAQAPTATRSTVANLDATAALGGRKVGKTSAEMATNKAAKKAANKAAKKAGKKKAEQKADKKAARKGR